MNHNFDYKTIGKLKRTQQDLLQEPSRHAQCLSWRYSFLLSQLSQCMYCAVSLYRLTALGSFLSAFAVPLCVLRSEPTLWLLAYAQIREIQPTNTQSTNSISAIIRLITNLFALKCKWSNYEYFYWKGGEN